MRIICIEEHAIDLDIVKAAQPALQHEAPYIGLQSSVPRPRLADRPSAVTMQEAMALGTDLGQGRIKAMDDHGIQLQVVSWISPAQLAPADQAVSLTGAANDRLAEAIRANQTRLSGFAVLPWQQPATAATPPAVPPPVGHPKARSPSGRFGEGREPVKRRPELVGCGRPGGPEALGVGQLGPVVGASDPGA